MPEFVNPFSGMVPDRKLTTRELARAIRLSLSAEEEATHLYDSLADATDDPVAKATFLEIADEERVHVGEFQALLNRLLPDEQQWLQAGAVEVQEKVELVAQNKASATEAPKAAIPTVGNLKS